MKQLTKNTQDILTDYHCIVSWNSKVIVNPAFFLKQLVHVHVFLKYGSQSTIKIWCEYVRLLFTDKGLLLYICFLYIF